MGARMVSSSSSTLSITMYSSTLGPSESSSSVDWYSARRGKSVSRKTTCVVVMSLPLRGPSSTSSR
eukprot:827568-Pleurochrysis_carterae.AAC.1